MRVLQVYPQLNNAGTEMVIMNLYRNVDREKVQFDFLVQRPGELEDLVKEMGGRIFTIPKTKNYEKDVYNFLIEHPEYKIVHTHTHADMGKVLKTAKKAGVPVRIAHSHNYRGDVSKIVRVYKILSSWDIEQNATHFFACSNEAAQWLFPRKHKKAVVWNNGIDLDGFIFSQDERNKYREELKIPNNAKVCIHVGRFAEQKNHRKIIELFNILSKEYDDFYGILVGVGPLMDEIKSLSQSDRILFLGNRHDVSKLLSCADVFLFPSLYEGLGIVAVEAQASGLCCIASSRVPKSADIGTNLFIQKDLNEQNDVWVQAIKHEMENIDLIKREEKSKASLNSDYNIKKIAKVSQNFYLENGEGL